MFLGYTWQFLRKWSRGKKMLAEWAVPLVSVEAVNLVLICAFVAMGRLSFLHLG